VADPATNPITGVPGTAGSDPLALFATQIYDLFRGAGGTDINQSKAAAAAADPFSTQRPQYQQMLQGLLTDPTSFKADPGYQFALGQGQEAGLRSANKIYGTQRAGAIPIELAKYTEGYAAQNYDNRINQLLTLSGANTGSPGTAGLILASGYNQQRADLSGGAQGLSTLAQALGPLLKSMGLDPTKLFGPDMGSSAVDPITGQVTYGAGSNASTGMGDQGGWPGDTTGTDFTGVTGASSIGQDMGNWFAQSPDIGSATDWSSVIGDIFAPG